MALILPISILPFFQWKTKTHIESNWEFPKITLYFIFVGRLVKDKGINELVQAFSQLSQSNQNISLLLVGPLEEDLDPLNEETVHLIETLTNIYTVGYQADVRPYFAIADALVFPSYREGFPNVVLQAGAMGLPSIVTDINGCNEIVEQGVNGLIIPPKNTIALKEAMELLATKALLYSNLKSTAREKITSRFERKEVWQALLMEYESLNEKRS